MNQPLRIPLLLMMSVLFISMILFSCESTEENQDEIDFYVALPSPPVKVINTNGNWLVYDLHIKTPAISQVDISNDSVLLLSYKDFNTIEDAHFASIWLPYPQNGWDLPKLEHKFFYEDSMGKEKVYNYELTIEKIYPDPITIEFPVPSGIWYAEAAPSSSSYHTRALFPYQEPKYDKNQEAYLYGNNPQRYAIDYAKLVDGLPYKNDGSKLEDWYCYNLPVLAAMGGKVIYTKDGIPDNQTPSKLDYKTNIYNATGNVIYIEHEDGSIGNYSHLIPYSITVEIGDTVSVGQEIGRLGNSGNSFAPHLHMHVLTNPDGKELIEYPDGLYMESMPYRFSKFTKIGVLPTGYLDGENLEPFEPTILEEYENRLPSEDDVITY